MQTTLSEQDLSATELAAKFAPKMWLHGGETYWPMSVDEYLSQSRLWRQDSSGNKSFLDPTSPNTWIDDDSSSLDGHGYGVPAQGLSQFEHGADSRPQKWWRKPNRGCFAYWLEHSCDTPGKCDKPPCPFPPVYYYHREWRGCDLLSYWYFFGYSRFSAGFAHQGDWESVSLLIGDGAVQRAWFCSHGKYQHRDLGEFKSEGDRVVGYFAKSRHGTYWEPKKHDPSKSQDLGEIGDIIDSGLGKEDAGPGSVYLAQSVQSDEELHEQEGLIPTHDETHQGYPWPLETLDLRRLEAEEWKGYAGAWGKPGRLLPVTRHTTGPTGPWSGKRTELDRALEKAVEASGKQAITCRWVARQPIGGRLARIQQGFGLRYRLT